MPRKNERLDPTDHPKTIRSLVERMVWKRMADDALNGLRRAGGLPPAINRGDQEKSSSATLSVEAIVGLAFAVLLAVVPMGFWTAIGFWLTLLAVITDFVWRSPLTADLQSRWKVFTTAVVLLVGGPIGYGIADKKAREPEQIAEAIIKRLPSASSQNSTAIGIGTNGPLLNRWLNHDDLARPSDSFLECFENSFTITLYPISERADALLTIHNGGPGTITVIPAKGDLLMGREKLELHPADLVNMRGSRGTWLF
jgi:hypothetical protein